MNLNRRIATLLLLFSAIFAYADMTEELRQALTRTNDGAERIEIYGHLFDLSLETDDLAYQLRCVNDLIAETHRQGEKKEEGDARVTKMTLFFNNELNDSLCEQVPPLLNFLKDIKQWKNYYETWSLLVNTYNFTGRTNTGLKEVQAMYEDAKKNNNQYGMGMAYYAMGIGYANMNNYDEAAESYEKSIRLLMNVDLKVDSLPPMQLSDIFAYYSDALEAKHDYRKMEQLTHQWSDFLTSYYQKKGKTNEETVNRWAYYYLARAQADLGLDSLERASEMLDEVKKRCYSEDSFLYMMWLYYRAELSRKQHLYDEALAFNNLRMKLLMVTDDKSELIRVRQQRARICEALGRYEEAAQLYNEMYTINDSINTHDTKRQLTEMNTLFHVDELKMQQAEEKARQQRTGIIIIASIIVIALSIFTYFRMRSAKRLKIAHEKLEATHQDLLTAYDQLEETTAAKERIESDLRIARDIQMSMVPSTFPERPDLDLFASMTPAKEVGGDLYGYHLIDDQLYFCLGDVSGKGVPASLFMAQATRLFRTLAAQKMMPAEIATRINNALSGEDNERGMFVTMFLGLVDLTTGHLHFCNAGHNPPVLIGEGSAEFIEMIPNAPIGLWPELDYEGEEIEDITNRPFFVYTDGLNEAENRQQEQFSDERLLEILQTTPFESAQQTITMLRDAVEKHRDGAEPNDDLTMLCLKVMKCEIQ